MNTTPSIFCGDLSFFCTDSDLSQLFQTIGPVKSSIVRRSRNNETLHYGFVHMQTYEDAVRAVQELNGHKFLGRRLRLNLGTSTLQAKEKDDSFQMHVSFISHNTRMRIDEEQLDRIFGQFGNVQDAIIKQYALSSDPAKQCGYGFVFFSEESCVHRAVRASNLSLIENIHFDCKMSHHTNTKDTHHADNSDSDNNKQSCNTAESHPKNMQYSASPPAPRATSSSHISSTVPIAYYIPDNMINHVSNMNCYPPNIQPPSSSIPSFPSPPLLMPYPLQPPSAVYPGMQQVQPLQQVRSTSANSVGSFPSRISSPHQLTMGTLVATANGSEFSNNNKTMIPPTHVFLPAAPAQYVMPSSYPSNSNFHGINASQGTSTNNSSTSSTPIPGTPPPPIIHNNSTNNMPAQQLPPPHPKSPVSPPGVIHNPPPLYVIPNSQFPHNYSQLAPSPPPPAMMMFSAQTPTLSVSTINTAQPPVQQHLAHHGMPFIAAPMSSHAPMDAFYHPVQPISYAPQQVPVSNAYNQMSTNYAMYHNNIHYNANTHPVNDGEQKSSVRQFNSPDRAKQNHETFHAPPQSRNA